MVPQYTPDDMLRVIHGADTFHMIFLEQFQIGVAELIEHLHNGQSQRALVRAEGLHREVAGYMDQLSRRISEAKSGEASKEAGQ